ncbi:hypothetical protein ACPYO6_08075 [Georgenia sp. Z1344]|uniref:hypothetical protein n=1 Tax=Georgenia sp. Z1344 TaxID=3416706 RepID=UPI003CEFF387
MRRRTRAERGLVPVAPAHLVEFRDEDWTAATPYRRFAQWLDARAAWQDEVGEEAAEGLTIDQIPDGPFDPREI